MRGCCRCPSIVAACGRWKDRALLAQCDYVYVTPSHQCPTTATMPLERRHALLQMAQAHDSS